MPLASAAFSAVVTIREPMTVASAFPRLRLDIGDRFPAWQQARARHHRREGIEHVMLGFFLHRFRQRLFERARNVSREPVHDGGNRGRAFGGACHGMLVKGQR
jgi:hypothetical protein